MGAISGLKKGPKLCRIDVALLRVLMQALQSTAVAAIREKEIQRRSSTAMLRSQAAA